MALRVGLGLRRDLQASHLTDGVEGLSPEAVALQGLQIGEGRQLGGSVGGDHQRELRRGHATPVILDLDERGPRNGERLAIANDLTWMRPNP